MVAGPGRRRRGSTSPTRTSSAPTSTPSGSPRPAVASVARSPTCSTLDEERPTLAAHASRARAARRTRRARRARATARRARCSTRIAASSTRPTGAPTSWLDEALARGARSRSTAPATAGASLYRAALDAARDARTTVIDDASRAPTRARSRAAAPRARPRRSSSCCAATTDEPRCSPTSTATATSPARASCPATASRACRCRPSSRRAAAARARDEFLSRPGSSRSRVRAARIVYHEGARYVINRVILPAERDGGEPACRRARPSSARAAATSTRSPTAPGPDVCERCGAAARPPLRDLLPAAERRHQRRDRITSDEEERQRQGYEVRTGVRFAERDGASTARRARRRSTDGDAGGTLDVRPRRDASGGSTSAGAAQDQRTQLGFVLDIERGYWAKNDRGRGRRQGRPDVSRSRSASSRSSRTAATACSFEPARAARRRARWPRSQAALKNAIQVDVPARGPELAAEPLPDRDAAQLLLFYEAAEGGAGVLRRLLDDPTRSPAVARRGARALPLRPRHRRRPAAGARRATRTARRPATTACSQLRATSATTGCSTASRSATRCSCCADAEVEVVSAVRCRAPTISRSSKPAATRSSSGGSSTSSTSTATAADARARSSSSGLRARPDFLYDGTTRARLRRRAAPRLRRASASATPSRRRALEDDGYRSSASTTTSDWDADRSPAIPSVFGKERVMSFAVGSLVARARPRVGRAARVRPTTSSCCARSAAPTTRSPASCTALETVDAGDVRPARPRTTSATHRSARLLRDALRLGFRSSAGPVPLASAASPSSRGPTSSCRCSWRCKLDPVRLLIADDVGIGKTIEALPDRARAARPGRGPAARRALPAAPRRAVAGRAARQVPPRRRARARRRPPPAWSAACRVGESLFERHPSRRRLDSTSSSPTAAATTSSAPPRARDRRRGPHLRRRRRRPRRPPPAPRARHGARRRRRTATCILVTATPHSRQGRRLPLAARASSTRRSPTCPTTSSGERTTPSAARLARHLVQRRRGDIDALPRRDTPFPERDGARGDLHAHARVPRAVRRRCSPTRARRSRPGRRRRTASASAGGRRSALLRVARPRARPPPPRRCATAPAPPTRPRAEEADELGRRAVLDLADDESAEGIDVAPGADAEDGRRPRPRRAAGGCSRLAREADALARRRATPSSPGRSTLVKELLERRLQPDRLLPLHPHRRVRRRARSARSCQGRRGRGGHRARSRRRARGRASPRSATPSGACWSPPTASPRASTSRSTSTPSSTTTSPGTRPATSSARAASTATASRRDGPRRSPTTAATTRSTASCSRCCCASTSAIRNSLGDLRAGARRHSNAVLEAILEGLVLRGRDEQLSLLRRCPTSSPKRDELHDEWDAAAEREKRSRTVFAQETIKTRRGRARARRGARGDRLRADVVERFVARRARARTARRVSRRDPIDDRPRARRPRALRDALGLGEPTSVARHASSSPVADGVSYLVRTHPVVEALAGYVLDTALDPIARRASPRAAA